MVRSNRARHMPRSALRQPVRMSGELTARIMFAGRSSSLSAQIVAWVRDALFARKLKPGDFRGVFWAELEPAWGHLAG